MQEWANITLDTETLCGKPLEDWDMHFRVSWEYDYDEGYIATAHLHSAPLGGADIKRHQLLQILGESAVMDLEAEAAQYLADNAADYMVAA